jgi:hypothetical protein
MLAIEFVSAAALVGFEMPERDPFFGDRYETSAARRRELVFVAHGGKRSLNRLCGAKQANASASASMR